MKVRNHWFTHIEDARKCAYRAETIDPDYPGQMRYDLMIEIVNLETRRINDFLSAFDHYRSIIYSPDITEDDESYCDQTMISYLD